MSQDFNSEELTADRIDSLSFEHQSTQQALIVPNIGLEKLKVKDAQRIIDKQAKKE